MEGFWAASYVILWLLVIALSIVVVALARQIGTLHLRLGPRGALELDTEGPPLGEAPESFQLTAIDGNSVSIGGPGEGQLLVFVSPGCMVCNEVLPSVDAVARAGRMQAIVLTDVDAHESRRELGAKRIGAPVVPALEIFSSYSVPGTPYVVVLDERGVAQAKGTVNNLEQVEGLVDTAHRRVAESRQKEAV